MHSFRSGVAAAICCWITAANAPHPAHALDGGACDVVLSRMSYDDPGVDDAEFLELRIPTRQEPTRFCECGVTQLQLLDGSGATCEPYRTIDISTLVSDARGFALLCAASSRVHADAHCDFTGSPAGDLGNGWLQNGPEDAIRLLGPGGVVRAVYAYGADTGVCSGQTGVMVLPADASQRQSEETEAGGAGDNIIVACGGGYETRTLPEAPLRSTECPGAEPSRLDTLDAGAVSTLVLDGGVAPSAPSRQHGAVLQQRGTLASPPWDAAIWNSTDAGRPREQLPEQKAPSVGCGLGWRRQSAGWAAVLLFYLLYATLVARRVGRP